MKPRRRKTCKCLEAPSLMYNLQPTGYLTHESNDLDQGHNFMMIASASSFSGQRSSRSLYLAMGPLMPDKTLLGR